MIMFEKILSIILTPNFLTLFRIGVAPVLIVLALYPTRFLSFMAAVLFSIAAITDYLDGFLARKNGNAMVTTFGKVMDPLADKVIVSTSFILLVSLGRMPAWIACVIIARELSVTALRTLIAQSENGGDVAASSLGKYKTGFQISAIIPLFIHYSYFTVNFHVIGMFFLWCALVLTIFSGAKYFIKSKDLLMN